MGTCTVSATRTDGSLVVAPYDPATVTALTAGTTHAELTCVCESQWAGPACTVPVGTPPSTLRVWPGSAVTPSDVAMPRGQAPVLCDASMVFIPTTSITQYVAGCQAEAQRTSAAGEECARSAAEVALRPFYWPYNARGFGPQASPLRGSMPTDTQACAAAGGALLSLRQFQAGGAYVWYMYRRFWDSWLPTQPWGAPPTPATVQWVAAGTPPGDWVPRPGVANDTFCIRLRNDTAGGRPVTVFVPLGGVLVQGRLDTSVGAVPYPGTPPANPALATCIFYAPPMCVFDTCQGGIAPVPSGQTVFV